MNNTVTQAQQALQQADALLITTGAGMGVDSGLPDFRGNEGFWRAYPPMKKMGASFIDMANPEWFESHPEIAWGFYGHRLNLYRATQPHKGFQLLLDIAQNKPAGYFVFTSNVDGQFQKAGFASERIEECHGSIHHLQCVHACTPAIWPAAEEKVIVSDEFRARPPLPSCPHCGGLARPNILMFGDYAWLSSRSSEQSERMYTWLKALQQKQASLAIVEIGAGKAVPTVRHFSERVLRQLPAHFIRINPRDADGPQGTLGIATGALDGIQALVNDDGE